MTVLVVGGSGSGKSAYAEELAGDLGTAHDMDAGMRMQKYYLATMKAYDEESHRKIDRHRRLRSGKGFRTVEQSVDIHQALGRMEAGEKTVLLECVSNLVANEMFSEKEPKAGIQAVGDIIDGISMIQRQTSHLIIVSNNVFEDGITYDGATMEYIRIMGKVNQALAAMADRVVEVVAGIPVVVKGSYNNKILQSKIMGTGMKLMIGGYAQGKLDYAKRRYCLQDVEIWDGMIPEHFLSGNAMPEDIRLTYGFTKKVPVINHFHLWVKNSLLAGGCPEEEIALFLQHYKECIIISDEIGNGIVPVEPFEREYRERTGRILAGLADRADEVVRVICGIGQKLK